MRLDDRHGSSRREWNGCSFRLHHEEGKVQAKEINLSLSLFLSLSLSFSFSHSRTHSRQEKSQIQKKKKKSYFVDDFLVSNTENSCRSKKIKKTKIISLSLFLYNSFPFILTSYNSSFMSFLFFLLLSIFFTIFFKWKNFI